MEVQSTGEILSPPHIYSILIDDRREEEKISNRHSLFEIFSISVSPHKEVSSLCGEENLFYFNEGTEVEIKILLIKGLPFIIRINFLETEIIHRILRT